MNMVDDRINDTTTFEHLHYAKRNADQLRPAS